MRNPESVDISIVRNINSRALLDTVFGCEVTSRSALAKLLGMSKSSVSANLAPLIDCGIIAELGEGEVSVAGGRKPQLISFNKEHKYIIAIDLNMTSPLFVLGNLKGEQLGEFSVNIEEDISQEDYLKMLENAVSLLISSRGIENTDICYIAVAAPGVFDEHSRLCSSNRNYRGVKWKTLDLRSLLEEKFNIPVFIKNDVKTAAWGEWVNSPRKTDNMLYISRGVGIGTGLILEGRLYDGFNHAAGEIYNYIDSSSLKKEETVEDTVCLKWLLDKIENDISNGAKTVLANQMNIGFDNIVAAYRAEDKYVLSVVEEIADKLSILIANFVNLLDIDCVVLGGQYRKFAPTVIARFEEKFSKYCRRTPKILPSILKQYAGVQGLFSIAKNNYFNTVCN